MRTISKSLKFLIRFGTRFSIISLVLFLIGISILTQSILIDLNSLPIAVVFILIGMTLLLVSIIRSNKIIKLLETGKHSKGYFKKWQNSFIIFNNNSLVFLIYTYYDNSKKMKEISVLASSARGKDEVNIIYKDEESIVLEYLPGKPIMNDMNEILRG